MPDTKPSSIHPVQIPPLPAVAAQFLQLQELQQNQQQAVDALVSQYPEFFQRILKIINSSHHESTESAGSLYQAIKWHGFEVVTTQVLLQAVYRTFNQYRINGLDMLEFWQDMLRRGVSARLLGEQLGLDACQCFSAGFMQDLGFLLLFLQQPDKGVLWQEFRRRDPQARYSMEQNVFQQTHDSQLEAFFECWPVMAEIKPPLLAHHACNTATQSTKDKRLCHVLSCADLLSAVFTADDKAFVFNRLRKRLHDEFAMEAYQIRHLLEAIPDAVNQSAQNLDMPVGEHTEFAQILYQANMRLNEDNLNFQELTARLEQALDERDRLAAEINRDLNLAREIQQSLLPDVRQQNVPVNGINLSAKILSGDFYDYFSLDNGDIYFNLADVSGKGVNAALLMAKASSIFHCLGKRITDPAQLLFEVNNELCETAVHGMFVTMVAGVYSPHSGEVRLVNAGHPPALLFTEDGLCREFEATAPPLGVVANIHYTEYRFQLGNDSLYMYSDGVTEGYIDDHSTLELSGLFKLIATMDSRLPAAERLQQIIEPFEQTAQPLRDDVTLLLVEKPVQDDKHKQ
ncbi:MAG TPA: SpoIIE family protein phosphatase [Gammaproteobacteria bacterium]